MSDVWFRDMRVNDDGDVIMSGRVKKNPEGMNDHLAAYWYQGEWRYAITGTTFAHSATPKGKIVAMPGFNIIER